MPEVGEDSRPQPPSPEEYSRLRKSAHSLRDHSSAGSLKSSSRLMPSGVNAYARYTGIGIQFLFVMCAPLAAGYALDLWLGTGFVLLLVGALLGAAGSMIYVVRAVTRAEAGARGAGGTKTSGERRP